MVTSSSSLLIWLHAWSISVLLKARGYHHDKRRFDECNTVSALAVSAGRAVTTVSAAVTVNATAPTKKGEWSHSTACPMRTDSPDSELKITSPHVLYSFCVEIKPWKYELVQANLWIGRSLWPHRLRMFRYRLASFTDYVCPGLSRKWTRKI